MEKKSEPSKTDTQADLEINWRVVFGLIAAVVEFTLVEPGKPTHRL